MTCGWWPPDQKRRCGRTAEWKMIDGGIVIGSLCSNHKQDAAYALLEVTFKKIRRRKGRKVNA